MPSSTFRRWPRACSARAASWAPAGCSASAASATRCTAAAGTGAAGWTRNVGNIDYRNDIGDGLVLMDDGVIFAGGFMYNEATSTADKALVKLTP